MFGKKKSNIIQPAEASEEILIQISEISGITRKTKISVPAQYKAIVYVDQKPLFRIEPCINKEFVKSYGKEYISKEKASEKSLDFSEANSTFSELPKNGYRYRTLLGSASTSFLLVEMSRRMPRQRRCPHSNRRR